MPLRHPKLPDVWLLSDARNDAMLEAVLADVPQRIGFIFRHHHLAPAARQRRYAALVRVARGRGHLVLLAGSATPARRWRADGCYGAPMALGLRHGRGIAITTAHDLAEIGRANRRGADAVLLSPVHPTRSHPGAATLGPVRFRLLAARSLAPVIALGGMDKRKARALGWQRWAAIDGLSPNAGSATAEPPEP